MHDREIGIAANFLFAVFNKHEHTPEVAAEKTELIIEQAVALLYPKENNHIEFRDEWTLKYCSYLRDSLDEMIEKTKAVRLKRHIQNYVDIFMKE